MRKRHPAQWRGLGICDWRRPAPYPRIGATGLLAFSAIISLSILFPSAVCAQVPRHELRLATGSEGGTYHRIGREIADYLNSTGGAWTVTPAVTRGSSDNLARIAHAPEPASEPDDGRPSADLALVTQDAFDDFMAAGSDAEPIIIGAMYVGAAQFIIRRELIRTGTLSDLNGVRMYPGAAGSGTEAGTLAILRALGVHPVYVPEAGRTLGYGEAAQAMAAGEFGAVVLSGGPPVRAVSELFEGLPESFQILSFSDAELAQALDAIPGLFGSSIRARTYAGQSEDVATVGKRTLLIARRDAGAGSDDDKDAIWPAEVRAALIEGLSTPGEALRAERSHPLLQSLTPEFFGQSRTVNQER